MRFNRGFALSAVGSGAAVVALVAACSSDATPGTPAGSTASAVCAAPGGPTPGPTDTHCAGKTPQIVTPASCTVADAGAPEEKSDAGTDGGAAAAGDDDDDCEYGPTHFGTSGSDDDCKYTVSYTSTPICQGAAGVQFTVTVKNATTGAPVADMPQNLVIEVDIPTDPNAACDSKSTHPSPTTTALVQTAPGSGIYKGPIVFDAPGQWTVRFHIHEECLDILDDSPHGHIAFRFTVP